MILRPTLLILLIPLASGCPGPVEEGPGTDRLVIFHNATGPMCLEALAWLEAMRSEYPGLVVEEHLTTQEASVELLYEMEAGYGPSQGISATFGYLPIIFYHGQAFSGFDDDVKASLATLVAAGGA